MKYSIYLVIPHYDSQGIFSGIGSAVGNLNPLSSPKDGNSALSPFSVAQRMNNAGTSLMGQTAMTAMMPIINKNIKILFRDKELMNAILTIMRKNPSLMVDMFKFGPQLTSIINRKPGRGMTIKKLISSLVEFLSINEDAKQKALSLFVQLVDEYPSLYDLISDLIYVNKRDNPEAIENVKSSLIEIEAEEHATLTNMILLGTDFYKARPFFVSRIAGGFLKNDAEIYVPVRKGI